MSLLITLCISETPSPSEHPTGSSSPTLEPNPNSHQSSMRLIIIPLSIVVFLIALIFITLCVYKYCLSKKSRVFPDDDLFLPSFLFYSPPPLDANITHNNEKLSNVSNKNMKNPRKSFLINPFGIASFYINQYFSSTDSLDSLSSPYERI